jgi:DNA protecting protein DprA
MMIFDENEIFYIQVQIAKGLGAVTFRKIIHFLKNNQLQPSEFKDLQESAMRNEVGLSESQIAALIGSRKQAEDLFIVLLNKGIKIIGYLDDLYPSKLKKTLGEQAPFVIYAQGNLEILEGKAVGFCGSRNASTKGEWVATMASSEITKHGFVVVSGNARGIDTCAHSASLINGGKTIFVAPEGILNFSPRFESRKFIHLDNAVILSEFKPNESWSIQNAMQRNKTICGLSNAMILVQSGKTGGTFEAGNFALQANIPLFVAEYSDSDISGPGNPYFIEHGAKPIRKRPSDQMLNLDSLFENVDEHFQKPYYHPEIQASLFSDIPI